MTPTSQDFGRALCAHFGLKGDQVMRDIRVHTVANEALSVTLTIALMPQDLAGIAALMGAGSKAKGDDA